MTDNPAVLRLSEALARMTPAPWKVFRPADGYGHPGIDSADASVVVYGEVEEPEAGILGLHAEDDADGICLLRNEVPALLASHAALTDRLARAESAAARMDRPRFALAMATFDTERPGIALDAIADAYDALLSRPATEEGT